MTNRERNQPESGRNPPQKPSPRPGQTPENPREEEEEEESGNRREEEEESSPMPDRGTPGNQNR